MKKWKKIETGVKNNNLKSVEKEVLVKLFNLFNDENNELIKGIFSDEQVEVFLKDELIKNIEEEIKPKIIFYSISLKLKNDDESNEKYVIIIEHNQNGKKITVPYNVLDSDACMKFFENRSNNNIRNKEREKYSIFHFLIDIRVGLIENYKKNIELIIKIFELEFDGTNKKCKYQFFKINDEHKPIFNGTINISTEGAKIIIDKIIDL